MKTLWDFLRKVKALFLGQRPALPRCSKCGDEMLLDLEKTLGTCVDCLPPAYARRQRIRDRVGGGPPIAESPRAMGKATTR